MVIIQSTFLFIFWIFIKFIFVLAKDLNVIPKLNWA